MNTRKTNDYSPLIPGSQDYKEAERARKEMIAQLGSRNIPDLKERKSHARRVQQEYNIIHKRALAEAKAQAKRKVA